MLERAKKIYRGRLWMLPLWLTTGKAHKGDCPICEGRTIFVKFHPWLRDNYRCVRCWSIPRQRAIIKTLTDLIPDWTGMKVHESSPEGVASRFIENKAPTYIASHFMPEAAPGQIKNGFRCENLESMTFANDEFDLIVTQDVMEHVMGAEKAFAEIARTLKPGGRHVFTVPVYPRDATVVRARKSLDGSIEHILEPDYHKNPIDEEGSLVVREWGRDIVSFIETHSGLKTAVITFNTMDFGLSAEFLDVLVSQKPLNGPAESPVAS